MSAVHDLINQRFELNEQYHGSKENMAWLASTIYYGFCISSISALLLANASITLPVFIIFLFLSFIIFTAAMYFIILQFRMRWQSNDFQRAFNNILENINKNYTIPKFIKDFEIKQKEFKRPRSKKQIAFYTILWPFVFWRMSKMPTEYHTEIPSYVIALYLFLALNAVIIIKYIN